LGTLAEPRTETLAIGEMRFNQSGPKNALYHAAMARAITGQAVHSAAHVTSVPAARAPPKVRVG
jgi:hypothetical protein